MTEDDYRFMLADSRAKVLVVSEALFPKFANLIGSSPDLVQVIVSGANARGYRRFEDLMTAARPDPYLHTAPTTRDDMCFWLYTSGSTGKPKGAVHTHANLRLTADLYAAGVLGLQESDVCYSVAKLFFAYGLGNALTFPMAVGATTVLLPDRPTPELVAALLRRHPVTVFYAVPTFYAAFLASPSAPERCPPQAQACCLGRARRCRPRSGGAGRSATASTSSTASARPRCCTSSSPTTPGNVKYGTTGKPVPGYDIRLVDDDGAVIKANGEMGELQVRGPTSALMYWNNREKSRETFVGEWTRSGDKYVEDEEGYYVYCGRRDDMLKVGGIYVSPFEVEGALCTHPDVLEAAVVGWPDEEQLIKPKAFVVLKSADKAGEELARALQDHCKEQARALQISALDRIPRRAAEDRDRQDPALQAAGGERAGAEHVRRGDHDWCPPTLTRDAAASHSLPSGRDSARRLTTRFGGEAMRKAIFRADRA